MATKTPFYPTPTGKLSGSLVALNQPKTTSSKTPYFVPSPTGLPVTQSQVNFLSGARGSSSTPFYPTPTGQAPQMPVTLRSGQSVPSSSGAVLGASTYVPSAPKTISSSMLSMSGASGSSTGGTFSSSPVSLPGAPSASPVSFDMSSILTPALANMGYTIQNNQLVAPNVTEEEQTPELTRWQKIKESLKGMMPQQEDTAETYRKLEEEADLKNKRSLVNSLTSQLNSITSNRDAQLLQLRGVGAQEGVTEAVYGGQQAVISREAAIKALPVAAQLSAAQADLQSAQDYVDKYFTIITQDNQKKFDYQWKLLDSAISIADKEDQRKLEAKKEQVARNSTLMTNALNFAQTVAGKALDNGNQSAFSKITSLPTPDPYSQTFQQDLQNYNAKISSYGQSVGVGSGAGNGVYTEKQLKAITKLNEDVSKNATYSKTNSMRTYGDNVIASLSLSTGVGDIAAINQFQKVIDEGAVTRDQDVKLIQGAQSLVNSLKTKVKKLEKGETLSSTLRQEMRTAVESIYAAQIKALSKDPYIQAKTKEATLYGLTANDTILGELGAFSRTETSTPDSGSSLNLSDLNFKFN